MNHNRNEIQGDSYSTMLRFETNKAPTDFLDANQENNLFLEVITSLFPFGICTSRDNSQ
jgi:hypothetical protein